MKVCKYNGPRLTLTYFTARSNLDAYMHLNGNIVIMTFKKKKSVQQISKIRGGIKMFVH